MHHTYTNIRGKDKDLGYEILRIDPHQKWNPVYLFQPFYNLLLAAFFEWGVAFHDLDMDALRKRQKSRQQLTRELKGMASQGAQPDRQGLRRVPLLSAAAAAGARSCAGGADAAVRAGRDAFRTTLAADFSANVIRNVWSYMIIFCGHFPDQTYTFSRGGSRRTRPAAACTSASCSARPTSRASPLFHVISGNLGYQIEHHLYPDMPSTRYSEIAPRVKAICEKYELPYNTGPLFKQLGTVQRTILRLALPGGAPRPKPGPYRGEPTVDAASDPHQTAAAT